MPPNDQFDGVMDAIDASYDNEVNKLARKMETLEQKIKAGLDPELYQGLYDIFILSQWTNMSQLQ